MSPDRFFKVSYYVDLVIKGSIAIVMGVAGWFLKETAEDVKDLRTRQGVNASDIEVLKEGKFHLQKQLDRIEHKLDRLVEK